MNLMQINIGLKIGYLLSFYNELIKKQEFVLLDKVIDVHVIDFKDRRCFPELTMVMIK